MSEITPRDIEALLETFEASNWSEMKLKLDGLELFFSKTPGARPLQSFAEPAAPARRPRRACAISAPGRSDAP